MTEEDEQVLGWIQAPGTDTLSEWEAKQAAKAAAAAIRRGSASVARAAYQEAVLHNWVVRHMRPTLTDWKMLVRLRLEESPELSPLDQELLTLISEEPYG